MDNISIKRIATLHPKIVSEISDILIECEKNNVSIRITSAFRTAKEQEDLYTIGRSKPGRIVTKARAFESFHNYGLAVDICLLHKDKSISYSLTEDLDYDGISDWLEVVKIFKSKGYEWGGDWQNFKETPHFQKTFGYKHQDLKQKVLSLNVDKNGFVII